MNSRENGYKNVPEDPAPSTLPLAEKLLLRQLVDGLSEPETPVMEVVPAADAQQHVMTTPKIANIQPFSGNDCVHEWMNRLAREGKPMTYGFETTSDDDESEEPNGKGPHESTA
ncbi:hypothetical protein M3Y99_01999000 [Aphelenchoides fujianensis]|nr:hypothetical protein M3Y99_01999000 [Aphelenchoides fujianensis]